MIKLRFETKEVISPRYGNLPLTVIRLLADAKFRHSDGSLSKSLEAIVDSGAPTSVIPQSIWQGLDVEILVKEVTFGGINPRPECQIPASLGKVRCILTDALGNLSPELEILAFLAKTDQVPLILGFAGLLERFPVHFDYEGGEAYIEEK